jgi:putative SOS response-associated peptidase YedK
MADRGTKSNRSPSLTPVCDFLTTSPNDVVAPIHPKAMPVILTTDDERDVWLWARGTKRGRSSCHCRTTRSESC